MSFYTRQNKIFSGNKVYKNNSINKQVISNHINSSATNKLIGKNATDSLRVYSYQDPYYNNLGQFTRNTNCWINGVTNISCFSPAQLSGAAWYTRAGTLITSRHIVLSLIHI